jgi:hypothetical protein
MAHGYDLLVDRLRIRSVKIPRNLNMQICASIGSREVVLDHRTRSIEKMGKFLQREVAQI